MNVLLGGIAGVLLAAPVYFPVTQAQQAFQLTMDPNTVWIRAGESPVLQYRYNGVPFKPYVKELYTPGGVNVLLDAPPDHPHHHGLMFAVGVDGQNFWEETRYGGHQSHVVFDNVRLYGHFPGPFADSRVAEFKEWLFWKDATFQARLTEFRKIEVRQTDTPGTGAPATVLTWHSDLRVPKDREFVTLMGAHYFGLGMRLPRSMDETGKFLNADGKEGTVFRGEERLVQSNWCAYQVTADGKPVTIAMFGPSRPGGLTTWFTMAKPFAYMSATLRLHERPLELHTSLSLMYAVAIWDRHILPVQINAFYREWAHSDWQLDDRPSKAAGQIDEHK